MSEPVVAAEASAAAGDLGAGRALAAALAGEIGWGEAADVWAAELSDVERLWVLGAVLRICPFPAARHVVEAVVRDREAADAALGEAASRYALAADAVWQFAAETVAGPEEIAAGAAEAWLGLAPMEWVSRARPEAMLALLALGRAAGDAAWWDRAGEAVERALDEVERLTLLGLLVRACQFPEADALMDAAVRARHAGPDVPFLGPIRDCAEAWAAFATEAELKAYLLAAFGRLPKLDRVRFLAAAQKKVLE